MRISFTILLSYMICTFSLCQTLIPITPALNNSGVSNLIVFDGKLYFTATSGTVTNVYFINGNNDPVKVNSTDYPFPEEFTIVANKLVFSAGSTSRKAYYINPEASPTIKAITGNYENPTDFVANGNNIIFQSTSNNLANQGIYQWSGSLGQSPIKLSNKIGATFGSTEYYINRLDLQKNLTVSNNRLFFFQENGIYYINLNGTLNDALISGTNAKYYYPSGNVDNVSKIVGNKIVYLAGDTPIGLSDGLMVIDASASTLEGVYIPVNSADSAPDHLFAFGDLMFFTATSGNNYNLHYLSPNNQVSIVGGNNTSITSPFNSADDPIGLINNKLYYGNNEVTFGSGTPSVSTTSECFSSLIKGSTLFYNNKIHYVGFNNSGFGFEIKSCSPLKEETCINGDDNSIIKLVIYNDKIYFTDFTHPSYILKFPEDPNNGLCQTIVNNEKFTGNAYHDKNCNGLKDAGDIPLAGVTFTIEGTTNTQTSGSNGDFTFSNLAPGLLTVAANLPNGYVYKNPLNGKQTITLPSASNILQFGFCTSTVDSCSNVGLHFDGINDRINIPNQHNGNVEFTLESWFKSANVNDQGSTFHRLFTLGSFNRLEIADQQGKLFIFNGSGITTTQNIRDGNWHHMALVREGDRIKLYLDGLLIKNVVDAEVDLQSLRVGYFDNNGIQEQTLWKGGIDDIRLWNYPRSEMEILEGRFCKFGKDESGLIGYWDFVDGEAGQNNTTLSMVADKINNNHGTLVGFDLSGNESNFICSPIEINSCNKPENCNAECFTDKVNISTGVNFNDNSLIPIGGFEGGWQLIDGPNDLSYPSPAYVLNPNTPSWDVFPDARYISPFVNPSNNGQFSEPYLFERRFCVCESSIITINLECLVDNFTNIGLYDQAGNLIQNLITINTNSTSNFRFPAESSITTHSLPPGTYSIRAGLRNDGAVTMGLAIKGSITGANLIESGCCSAFTSLSGTVYIDEACNGSITFTTDDVQGDVLVFAYNSIGEVVDSTLTDEFGHYVFNDLPAGNYIIKQSALSGFELNEGANGININLQENFAIGNVNFGNCEDKICSNECSTNSVNLSTGIDINTGNTLQSGNFEGSWQLIDGPNDGVSYPRPAYVLTPHPAWSTLPNTMYISPFPSAFNNNQYAIPYLFQRCFCVCKDNTDVTLDIDALVDNFINIGLYDDSGNLISDLISYSGLPSSTTFHLPPFHSNTVHNLNEGVYCLRAGLRNDNSTAMGMAIKAIITGASLVKSGCCTPFSTITGSVYLDKNCNSIADLPQDGGMPTATVNLYDASGTNIIQTAQSDALGYFVFNNIAPGQYFIKQELVGAFTLSQGNGGYGVLIIQNEVVGNIDFGNCSSCCGTSEELTNAVVSGINSQNIVETEGHFVTVEGYNLLDCQYISKIYWGDGTSDIIPLNGSIPLHKYNVEGTYLITIEVVSKTNGNECQMDEVDFPIIISCIPTGVIDPQEPIAFKLYPIPAKNELKLELNKNANGFEITISNAIGKIVLNSTLPKSELIRNFDIANYSAGVYLIQLSNNQGEKLVSKFIKVK